MRKGLASSRGVPTPNTRSAVPASWHHQMLEPGLLVPAPSLTQDLRCKRDMVAPARLAPQRVRKMLASAPLIHEASGVGWRGISSVETPAPKHPLSYGLCAERPPKVFCLPRHICIITPHSYRHARRASATSSLAKLFPAFLPWVRWLLRLPVRCVPP